MTPRSIALALLTFLATGMLLESTSEAQLLRRRRCCVKESTCRPPIFLPRIRFRPCSPPACTYAVSTCNPSQCGGEVIGNFWRPISPYCEGDCYCQIPGWDPDSPPGYRGTFQCKLAENNVNRIFISLDTNRNGSNSAQKKVFAECFEQQGGDSIFKVGYWKDNNDPNPEFALTLKYNPDNPYRVPTMTIPEKSDYYFQVRFGAWAETFPYTFGIDENVDSGTELQFGRWRITRHWAPGPENADQ